MPSLPLSGVTVFELAGLAPGPLCGQILSDYGARVIRVDRPPSKSSPNVDQLTRGKQSIALNLRLPAAQAALRAILETNKVDVLLDTYRPGVLERLNILPTVRPKDASPLIVARLTGYGQTGPLASFPGHDINYLAESGVLGIVGPPDSPPTVPANILGDFAALSLPGFASIMTALYSNLRSRLSGTLSTDPYTLIDVNIVHSLKYLAQFATYAKHGPYDPRESSPSEKPNHVSIVPWDAPRGKNMLEGFVCPFYTTYKTKDSAYITVGALEPQFYAEFLKLIFERHENRQKVIDSLPDRLNPQNWNTLRRIFAHEFEKQDLQYWAAKSRQYPDSCVMPVKKIAHSSEIPDQIVQFGKGSASSLPKGFTLTPGKDTDNILNEFLGSEWKSAFGQDFAIQANLSKSKL